MINEEFYDFIKEKVVDAEEIVLFMESLKNKDYNTELIISMVASHIASHCYKLN